MQDKSTQSEKYVMPINERQRFASRLSTMSDLRDDDASAQALEDWLWSKGLYKISIDSENVRNNCLYLSLVVIARELGLQFHDAFNPASGSVQWLEVSTLRRAAVEYFDSLWGSGDRSELEQHLKFETMLLHPQCAGSMDKARVKWREEQLAGGMGDTLALSMLCRRFGFTATVSMPNANQTHESSTITFTNPLLPLQTTVVHLSLVNRHFEPWLPQNGLLHLPVDFLRGLAPEVWSCTPSQSVDPVRRPCSSR